MREKKKIYRPQYKPQISFIMPAYNSRKYIFDPIKELQKENKIKWELIIIDDFSNDNTYDFVKTFANSDKRVKIFRNLKKGKVRAINYGYQKSAGDIIKFIDSDDVLCNEYFRYYSYLKKNDSHFHDMIITDDKLKKITNYRINPIFIFKDYKHIASKLITFPKAVWSFNREIAKKIFPMPEDLPFEDVWINLIIKKNSKRMYHINKSIYKYRQHGDQTFGGILNYDKKKILFRAKRMLKLIKVLKKEPRITFGVEKKLFYNINAFFQMMNLKKLSYFKILFSNQSFEQKLKLILYKKATNLVKYFLYVKWKFDEIKKSWIK